MARQNRRDRWSWAVARAQTLHPTTRLFLSTCLARHMRAGGFVSYPRHKLAAEFGITERRVSSHIQKAKDAGWLIVRAPGFRTRTAEYEATFPNEERVSAPVTLSEPKKGDANKHPLWVTRTSPFPPERVTRTSPQVVSTSRDYACTSEHDTCPCLDCSEWRVSIDRLIASSHCRPERTVRDTVRDSHLRLVVA